jgi:hypothetical protein
MTSPPVAREPSDRGSAVATYLLSWSYTGAGPTYVDETLAIDAQGGIWCWLLAAAEPARRDRCGTFALPADPALAREAGRLAAALRVLPPVSEPLPRGGVALVIDAGGSRHALNATAGGERDPVIVDALRFAEQLRPRALAAPLAALQIALEPRSAAPGAPAPVMFAVTSLGAEPVRFQFDPDSFAVFGYDAAGRTFTWRAAEGDTMGLLDSETLDLIDGVLIEATMPGGMRALAAFNNALLAEPGSYTLTGSASGMLALHRPDAPPPPIPNSTFRVTTPPVAWTAR